MTEPMECNRENCEHGADEQHFHLHIEFFGSHESGDMAARIDTHIHNAPPEATVQAMIALCLTLVENRYAHDGVLSQMPHEVAHPLAAVMAREFLRKLIDNSKDLTSLHNFAVPDDASELLGD